VQFAVRKVIAQAGPDGRPDPPLATPEGVCRASRTAVTALMCASRDSGGGPAV
jgi:hypothetical protein